MDLMSYGMRRPCIIVYGWIVVEVLITMEFGAVLHKTATLALLMPVITAIGTMARFRLVRSVLVTIIVLRISRPTRIW